MAGAGPYFGLPHDMQQEDQPMINNLQSLDTELQFHSHQMNPPGGGRDAAYRPSQQVQHSDNNLDLSIPVGQDPSFAFPAVSLWDNVSYDAQQTMSRAPPTHLNHYGATVYPPPPGTERHPHDADNIKSANQGDRFPEADADQQPHGLQLGYNAFSPSTEWPTSRNAMAQSHGIYYQQGPRTSLTPGATNFNLDFATTQRPTGTQSAYTTQTSTRSVTPRVTPGANHLPKTPTSKKGRLRESCMRCDKKPYYVNSASFGGICGGCREKMRRRALGATQSTLSVTDPAHIRPRSGHLPAQSSNSPFVYNALPVPPVLVQPTKTPIIDNATLSVQPSTNAVSENAITAPQRLPTPHNEGDGEELPEGNEKGGNDAGTVAIQYQAIFATPAEALAHVTPLEERDPLQILNDDVASVDHKKLHEYSRSLFEKFLYQSSKAPEWLDEEDVAIYAAQQDIALTKCRDAMASPRGVTMASARSMLVCQAAVDIHKHGIPINTISTRKDGSNGYYLDRTSKFSERISKIISAVAENKLVACDVLSGDGVDDLASAPVDYLRRKIRNFKGNLAKARLLKNGKRSEGDGAAESNAASSPAGHASTATSCTTPSAKNITTPASAPPSRNRAM